MSITDSWHTWLVTCVINVYETLMNYCFLQTLDGAGDGLCDDGNVVVGRITVISHFKDRWLQHRGRVPGSWKAWKPEERVQWWKSGKRGLEGCFGILEFCLETIFFHEHSSLSTGTGKGNFTSNSLSVQEVNDQLWIFSVKESQVLYSTRCTNGNCYSKLPEHQISRALLILGRIRSVQ